MADDKIEKEAVTGVEAVRKDGSHADTRNKIAISQAQAATDKEHKMTLMEGLRTYPKAIAWSMVISLCIVMEAFDVCLLNNFCMIGHTYHNQREELTYNRRSTAIPRQIWLSSL